MFMQSIFWKIVDFGFGAKNGVNNGNVYILFMFATRNHFMVDFVLLFTNAPFLCDSFMIVHHFYCIVWIWNEIQYLKLKRIRSKKYQINFKTSFTFFSLRFFLLLQNKGRELDILVHDCAKFVCMCVCVWHD